MHRTKEVIVDYRRQQGGRHLPIHTGGSAASSSSVCTSPRTSPGHFTWTLWSRKLAQFPEEIRYEHQHPHELLQVHHRELADGLHHGNYRNYSAHKSLKRVAEAAKNIIGNRLPAIQDISHRRCLRKTHSIIKDHNHPAHRLFSLLLSGRQYKSMAARTTRLKDSFYHQAIRLFNSLT